MNRHSLYVILCSTGSQRSWLHMVTQRQVHDDSSRCSHHTLQGAEKTPIAAVVDASPPACPRPCPPWPAVRNPISFHATAPINCRNASGTIAVRRRGGLRADFTHHQFRPPPPPTTAVIDCWSEMCANRTLPLANARSADKITRRRQMFD